jgi:GNAT superfamily N-acetyltransferase
MFRAITGDDFASCQAVFDASYYDLHHRFGMGEGEPEGEAWLPRILEHFLETDPDGGRIAIDDDGAYAFASTIRRDDFWFLSFLFVVPGRQGSGVGRGLLEALIPPPGGDQVRATVVESFQPVSTGLYASLGVTPKAIKYWLSGPTEPGRLPELPATIHKAALSAADGEAVDALDLKHLGFTRSVDHLWWRKSGTPAWVYRRDDALIAYAYLDEGYIGPALAENEETLRLVVADLVRSSDDPTSTTINLCGDSSETFRMLINAGARIDVETKYRFVYCSDAGPLGACYIHHSDWLP